MGNWCYDESDSNKGSKEMSDLKTVSNEELHTKSVEISSRLKILRANLLEHKVQVDGLELWIAELAGRLDDIYTEADIRKERGE